LCKMEKLLCVEMSLLKASVCKSVLCVKVSLCKSFSV
jgi:hypothetical protein